VDQDAIFYRFSRSMVERCDFTHFLSLYALHNLPTGAPLREMMNRLAFSVEGWESDPREIHLIPEVRRFYSSFHATWPLWLYFCKLDQDTLQAMIICCLPSATTTQVDRRTQVRVVCHGLDMSESIKRTFVECDFLAMDLICERAQMSKHEIDDRRRAVFEHFNIPFEVEPPPP